MQASHAVVTHGPLTVIRGTLPTVAAGLLTRAGAFRDEGDWKCLPDQWPKVQNVLTMLGVPFEAVGEASVPAPVIVPDAPPKSAAVSLLAGQIRVQGDLPKPVQKHWLGSQRSNGHVGMSPWALEEFLEACEEQRIVVELADDARRLRDRLRRRREAIDYVMEAPPEDLPEVPLEWSSLNLEQRRAIAFIEACNGRAFIADAVGGRKTTTAIGWKRYSQAQRIVVVAPSSVKGSWQEKINLFDGGLSIILDGYRSPTTPRPHPAVQWIIIGYETLFDREVQRKGKGKTTYLGWLDYLRDWKPDLVIVDESHNARGDGGSERAQAMEALCKTSRDALAMTATPQSESPMDRYSQLNALEPGWWGSWFEYGIAFCNGRRRMRHVGKRSWPYYDMGGTSNADVLRRRMRYVVLARDRKKLGTEIPSERIPVYMELDPEARKEYDEVYEEYREFVRKENEKEEPEDPDEAENARPSFMRSMSKRMQFILRMRQISSKGCVQGSADFAVNLLREGKRPVVFAYFVEPLQGLEQALRARGLSVGLIRGGVPRKKREEYRQAFRDGRLDVMVCQTQAGGVGLDMHEGSFTTFTHELTHVPLDIIQTEGRVNRDGQKAPKTYHYYRLAKNTRDELVLRVVIDKMAANAELEKDLDDEIAREIEKEFFR